jgi:hypothetical protein
MSAKRLNYTDTKKYIQKLEGIIKARQSKELEKTVEDHRKILNIILDFVRHKKLMVYGGYAINAILPSSDKLYTQNDQADIDFFSHQAKKDAVQLADIFFKKGYQYVEVKVGMHYETFKLYVNFTPVADITDIPRRLFNRMKMMAVREKELVFGHLTKLDIPLAPLAFLRLSLHLELSRPEGYIERWVKVYKRMTLLYDYYPILYDQKCTYLQIEKNPRILMLKDALLSIVKQLDVPLLGTEGIKAYLQKGGIDINHRGIVHPSMTLMDIIAYDYKGTITKIIEMLTPCLKEHESLQSTQHSPLNLSEILPRHQILTYLNKKTNVQRPLIAVYKSHACYSYKVDPKGFKLASIDTILSFMYAWLMADRVYFNVDRIECMLSILLHVQYIHLNNGNPIFELFEQHCYGKQQKLSDLRKKLWKQRKDIIVYRPVA